MDEEPDQPEPLDEEEREDIEADLDDLKAMRAVFEAQGMRGVVVACPDCGSDHYYDWDLLRESLEHMLETGEPRMHEPAFEPREEDYVLWDYGKGYVDALSDAGLDDDTTIDVHRCAWCETPLEPHYGYCPKCGRPSAVGRLLKELVGRGMDEREARALLVKAGFEPFS
ncbi:MAG TPA: DUF5319 family protein [Actinomycetota bacterium]|nr:DUF5319 family protein [Actinomycetota bacterium]